jgi:hypothetical protein
MASKQMVPTEAPTSLAPLKELLRSEKVFPAEAFAAAYKRMDEITREGDFSENQAKESTHCARAITVCLATYRIMPEIFESTLAFPGAAYIQSGSHRHASRTMDAPNLLGRKQGDPYTRAPRPDDA